MGMRMRCQSMERVAMMRAWVKPIMGMMMTYGNDFEDEMQEYGESCQDEGGKDHLHE